MVTCQAPAIWPCPSVVTLLNIRSSKDSGIYWNSECSTYRRRSWDMLWAAFPMWQCLRPLVHEQTYMVAVSTPVYSCFWGEDRCFLSFRLAFVACPYELFRETRSPLRFRVVHMVLFAPRLRKRLDVLRIFRAWSRTIASSWYVIFSDLGPQGRLRKWQRAAAVCRYAFSKSHRGVSWAVCVPKNTKLN